MIDYTKRIGEINKNNFGEVMKIVEYNNAKNLVIEFENGEKVYKIQYDNFKKGKVKNPYSKTLYGVACCGDTRKIKVEYLDTIYDGWHNMIERCYAPHDNTNSYKNKKCYVCKEWLCFENYYYWYKENYYKVEKERMCLDKDILIKGNNCYSPKTCIFVPELINITFIKTQYNKKLDVPIGVRKESNKYRGVCRKRNKNVLSELYDNMEDAFNFYKVTKESYIKELAELYKDKIPQKLYNALYSYKVEITD